MFDIGASGDSHHKGEDVFGNIKLIIDLLRTFGKYAALLPLVRETIAAIKAGDWPLVAEKIEELVRKAGLITGGPVLFGQVPLGLPGPLPADISDALDALEVGC